jgi:pimeloyl-ACP methyl ester carboxylesterase
MTDAGAAPNAPPRLTITAALARLEAEAERGVLDTGRYRCRYVAWGEGPPVVFLHGLGDMGRTFALTMALLRRHFRCITYDQPTGTGDGARLRRYRHAHLVDDLLRLLDHLKADTAMLVGHSFGSSVVLRALHRQPQRFPRGALVGGFPHRPLTLQQRWLAWAGKIAPPWMTLGTLRGRDDAMQRSHYEPFARHEPERWEFFLEATGRTPLRAMGHWGLELNRTDLRPLLPRIRQPVLLLCGDRDPLVPQAYQDYLLYNLPHAIMFQITGCGHMAAQTHPEVMAEKLLQFHAMPVCPLANVCAAQGACPTPHVHPHAECSTNGACAPPVSRHT